VGDPVIENLSVKVTPFATTAKSKLQILDGLSLALEQGDVKWPRTRGADASASGLPQLNTEMLLYQDDDAELVQDCVMALAMTLWGAGQKPRPKVDIL